MLHGTHTKRPHKLIVLGLIALAIANVGNYIIQRKLALSEHIADPLSGFLMGVAIALLLIGIRAQAKALRK